MFDWNGDGKHDLQDDIYYLSEIDKIKSVNENDSDNYRYYHNGTCLSLEQIADKMNLDLDRVKLLEKNTLIKNMRVNKIQTKLSKTNTFVSTAKAVIIGHAVGDALGVPVEFMERTELDKNPVTDMREYGTYNMPKGAWSDDTSMSLCALDALDGDKINFDRIMTNFGKWYYSDKFTPTGEMFDVGNTCSIAIENYFIHKKSWRDCGLSDSQSNGNGSLMRIHPFVLYTYLSDTNIKTKIEIIELASALTHAHPRAKLACGIYAFVLWELLDDESKHDNKETIRRGLRKARKYYSDNPEFKFYSLKLCRQIADIDYIGEDSDAYHRATRDDIISDGYVVHSLEAAIWCLYTTDNYKDCVLKAVNLGDDTDTTAAIAGGLAGAMYGYDAIPKEWRNTLIKREYIEELCEKAFNRI